MSEAAVILRLTQVNKGVPQTYCILEPLSDIQQHQTTYVKAPGTLHSKNEIQIQLIVLCMRVLMS